MKSKKDNDYIMGLVKDEKRVVQKKARLDVIEKVEISYNAVNLVSVAYNSLSPISCNIRENLSATPSKKLQEKEFLIPQFDQYIFYTRLKNL